MKRKYGSFLVLTPVFILGILSLSIFPYWEIEFYFLLGLFFIFSGLFFITRKRNVYDVVKLCFVCGFLSLFGRKLLYDYSTGREVENIHTVSSYVARIEQVGKKNLYFLYRCELVSLTGKRVGEINKSPLIDLYSKEALSANVGDEIVVKGRLRKYDSPQNPYEFNYAEYQKVKGVYYKGFIEGSDVALFRKARWSIWALSQRVRGRLLDAIDLYLNDVVARQVAKAILLGYKDELGKELKESYADSGTLHVLSVSGLHLGVFYCTLFYLFGLVSKKRSTRVLKSVILLVCVWMFAFLTGLAPPVIRSATMLTFFILKTIASRKGHSLHSLFIAAFLMLAINPNYIFEVGFQYSFLAVGGIVVFAPYLQSWLTSRYYLVNESWKLIAVSVSAQLTTFPLGLYYFHSFPTYFFIANVFVLFLVSVIVIEGFLFLLISKVSLLATMFGLVLEKLISLLNLCVKLIESIPGSTIKDIYLTPAQCSLIYLLILFLSCLFIFKKKGFLKSAFVASVVLFVVTVHHKFDIESNREITFYSLRKEQMIDVFDGIFYSPWLVGSSFGHTLSTTDLTYFIEPNRKSNGVKESFPQAKVNTALTKEYEVLVYKGVSVLVLKEDIDLRDRVDVDYLYMKRKKEYNNLITCDHLIIKECGYLRSNKYFHCLKKEGFMKIENPFY
ncbi:MAG: ComEC/Rec2 family competence protein [Cyclobacteriaceae bacterium]